MFFNAYIEPQVFEESLREGDDARLSLFHILRGFNQNCFVVIFEDGRWKNEIKAQLESWPADMARSNVKRQFVRLAKRKQFLYLPAPCYTGATSDRQVIIDNITEIPVDIIVSPNSADPAEVEALDQLTHRKEYAYSEFEELRSDRASNGRNTIEGELNSKEFMDDHFSRMFKFAEEIHITDRILGSSNFSGNFQFTFGKFLEWLNSNISGNHQPHLVIHTGNPSNTRYLESCMKDIRDEVMSELKITLHYYDETTGPTLPHYRNLMSEAVALDIDRGMDFLESTNGRNRHTRVTYADRKQIHKAISECASHLVGSVDLDPT